MTGGMRIVRCAVAVASCAALVSCGGDPAPSALRINPPSLVLGAGQSSNLTAFLVVDGSSERAGDGVTWSAADGAVVSVTPGGDGSATVMGLASGTTMVTATADGLSGNAMVTVREVPAVTDTSPGDGATGIAPPVDVEITFSLAMDDGLTAQTPIRQGT